MPDDLEARVREAARCGECFFIATRLPDMAVGRETKAAGPGGVYCDYCQDRRYVLTAAVVVRALEDVLDGVTDPDQQETRRYLVERFLDALREPPDA